MLVPTRQDRGARFQIDNPPSRPLLQRVTQCNDGMGRLGDRPEAVTNTTDSGTNKQQTSNDTYNTSRGRRSGGPSCGQKPEPDHRGLVRKCDAFSAQTWSLHGRLKAVLTKCAFQPTTVG